MHYKSIPNALYTNKQCTEIYVTRHFSEDVSCQGDKKKIMSREDESQGKRKDDGGISIHDILKSGFDIQS